jgi:hypothetical protein
MFTCLAEAIQSMEQSKREVELRIKARAQGLPQLDPAPAAGTIAAPPARLRVPRLRVEGRTIYTSGSRSSKK